MTLKFSSSCHCGHISVAHCRALLILLHYLYKLHDTRPEERQAQYKQETVLNRAMHGQSTQGEMRVLHRFSHKTDVNSAVSDLVGLTWAAPPALAVMDELSTLC